MHENNPSIYSPDARGSLISLQTTTMTPGRSQTDTQTRQTASQPDIQTDRQANRQRQTDRHRQTDTYRQIGIYTQTDTLTDRQTNRYR